MKLFSRMLTRKPTEEEAMGKIDLDMDDETNDRSSEPVADDTGQVNPTRVQTSRVRSAAQDPFASIESAPISERDEEPEEADGAGWGENPFAGDADWEDDTDWGDDDDDFGADSGVEAAPAKDRGSAVVGSVGSKSEGKDWENDDVFGRRAIARSRIGSQVEGAEDRLMDETDNKFGERESTRRRSAMAHLKAAAAATKADKVLSHVAGRDPTLDPDEQSPYREDLAKVVRPRSGSRPISRPVSKGQSIAEPWDEGPSDEDAALFAAASEPGARHDAVDPLAHVPDNLSAEDFADEDAFGDDFGDEFEEVETGSSRTSVMTAGVEEAEDPFSDDDFADTDEDESDNAFADDDDDYDGPVPSTAVAEALAIANGEMEFEEDEEEDDDDDDFDDEAIRSQLVGFSGGAEQVVETTSQTPESEEFVNVATAVSAVPAGRSGRSAGRVKTRLLGFQPGDDVAKDVFEAAREGSGPAATDFPVGWIVVTEGPGRGKCFTLFNGVSNIGRGEDQAVRLDFGDTSISRNNHAAVAFDIEQSKFFLGHGGKSNLVRLNGKPVLSTEEMSEGDEIRIGETTLKFVALCGPEFSWTNEDNNTQDDNE